MEDELEMLLRVVTDTSFPIFPSFLHWQKSPLTSTVAERQTVTVAQIDSGQGKDMAHTQQPNRSVS